MKKQKTRFETVPLAEVPDVVLREASGAEKIEEKSEPYAVEVERRQGSAPLHNPFRRPSERRH